MQEREKALRELTLDSVKGGDCDYDDAAHGNHDLRRNVAQAEQVAVGALDHEPHVGGACKGCEQADAHGSAYLNGQGNELGHELRERPVAEHGQHHATDDDGGRANGRRQIVGLQVVGQEDGHDGGRREHKGQVGKQPADDAAQTTSRSCGHHGGARVVARARELLWNHSQHKHARNKVNQAAVALAANRRLPPLNLEQHLGCLFDPPGFFVKLEVDQIGPCCHCQARRARLGVSIADCRRTNGRPGRQRRLVGDRRP